MIRRSIKFIPIILIAAQTAFAQAICPLDGSIIKPREVASLERFKKIAVLEGGRIKPLDTYARNILLRFSGKRTIEKKPAIDWFARLAFASEMTRDDKIFLINHPAIATAIGIEPEKKRRYSFAQLEPGFERLQELFLAAQQIDEKQRDIVENELIRVYKNVNLYSFLSLSFGFAFPHPAFTITNTQNLKQLNLPEDVNQFSLIDIVLRADGLQKITKDLETMEPQRWNDAQKEIIQIVSNLLQWSLVYRNMPFTIVPSYLPKDQLWYSPWDAMSQGLNTEEGRTELIALRDMLAAYWNGQQLEFDLAAKTFSNSVRKRMERKNATALKHLNLEVLFNRLHLFFTAKVLYLIAFLLFLISLINAAWILHKISLVLIALGFIPHATAIILRIMILGRPPVTNLYETFIFVGFASVLVGMIVELVNRQWLGIVISALSGFIFLTIAGKYSAEGDTLQMLVAVLNTNFWLGTHVLSITTGYAGVCVAGIVGHIYILQSLFKPNNKKLLDSTYRVLIGALGFGLTVVFLGTNLGGIWADQSWGRFWGWDPKENGALLIILWTALLFHARVAKLIGPLGLAVGSVLGIIVVMWAWFGVNLLSIGLHSYGFTSGVANSLLIYIFCELLFLCISIPLVKNKILKIRGK
jgi:ABC-type transport system involved in cytochrome c biogenesis permease subunit